MSGVHSLLLELHAQGIQLWVEEGQLKFRVTQGSLESEQRERIRQHKPEIIEFLRRAQAQSGRSRVQVPSLAAQPRPEALPLSFAQHRLWFLEQLDKAAEAAYHMAAGLRMSGELDLASLQAAFDRVVARHEILRTTFGTADGHAVQLIAPAQVGLQLRQSDLSGLAEPDQHRLTRELSDVEFSEPFDLLAGPLFRVRLLRLSAREHILLLTQHHIISDGWSIDVLIREISTLYAAFSQGQPDPLPALSVQYADYALWQRRWLTQDALQEQASYWRETLLGAPALCELPLDRARPAQQNFAGNLVPCVLDAQLTARLKHLARRHETTLFSLLLTGWGLLLSRLSGQQDLVIGTPTANRGHSEIQNLIGFFVNTLALRLDLSGSLTVGQLLARVKRQVLAAQGQQDLPFEQVVELVRPARSLTHNPIFQVFFAWQQGAGEGISLPGLDLTPFVRETHQTAKFDLTLALGEADGRIEGCIEYATALFEYATVARYLGYWRCLLEAMADDDSQTIERLPWLPSDERSQLLHAWSGQPAAYPHEYCAHEIFEAQARLTPLAPALVHGESVWAYAELDAQANRLARHLRDIGVKPDDRVAICAERGPHMVVSVLAVLKAGGAYVPLDPDYPFERLAYMLQDSAPVALLSYGTAAAEISTQLAATWPQLPMLDLSATSSAWSACSTDPLQPAAIGLQPTHLAYVIYTSGSTGQPKGVMVEHRNLVHSTWARRQVYGPPGRFVLLSSLAFDSSVAGIFGTLCYGGTLITVERAVARDPQQLLLEIERRQAQSLLCVPSLYQQLLEQPESARASCLATAILAGEALPAAVLAKSSQQLPATQLFNEYGPTEASVWCTVHRCEPTHDTNSVPIGRPIPNARIYLLDRYRQPVPVGVVGELYVGGAGVARGYLNRPQLSSEKFGRDPFTEDVEARMYRTGDLGRWLPDGSISFEGRGDSQVKLRGFRIELGEIEAQLAACPGVLEAVVMLREDRPGDKRLVAYLRMQEVLPSSPVELRNQLSRSLPEHMLPSSFVSLASLPRTPNGKLDYHALPPPELQASADTATRTPQQEILAALFCDVLGIEQIGLHDNFFELGGHSLLAMQLVNRIRSSFAVELPLNALFEAPNVAELDTRILSEQQSNNTWPPPLTAAPRPAVVPLSFAQERLWFLQQLDSNSTHFNLPLALRLEGNLDPDALAAACDDLVSRHESLRTLFPAVANGASAQQVVLAPTQARIVLERIDVVATDLPHVLATAAARRFDLNRDIPIRAQLFRLGETSHVLLLLLHHIAADGWSLRPLLRDLSHAYGERRLGQPPSWAPLPLHYADYAIWERQLFQQATAADQRSALLDKYWQDQLEDLPTQVILPADRARSAAASMRGDAVVFRIPTERHRQLISLAREHNATLFMVLHASVAALLSRLGAGQDIPIGTSVARRPSAALDDLVGIFLNLLVLRTNTAGNPRFNELLARVRDTDLAAYEHQDMPFERLVELVNPARSRSHHPLFQITIVLHNAGRPAVDLPELAVSLEEFPNPLAQFDLALHFAEIADTQGESLGIEARVGYACDLYDRRTVESFVARLLKVFDAVTSDASIPIGRINLLAKQQRPPMGDDGSAG